jgi:hypothetical protein
MTGNESGRNADALAYFVVRATVADAAKRKAFDEWYRDEHLPDAAQAFGVKKARRFWSITDPSLHVAMYAFADQSALDRAMGGDTLKALVAEFDRCWPGDAHARDADAGGGFGA